MKIVPVDSPKRIEDAVAVLTLAFCDDPVTRWLYPRPLVLIQQFPRLIWGFARFAFENASVRILEDGSGAAVWLPPDLHTDDDALGAIVTNDLDRSIRAEAEDFFGQMDSYHPGGDHWHLPLIGVEPGRRNHGSGAELLDEGLQRCDANHMPVYLESTNPRNLSLYGRHGFEPLGQIQVGTSPVMIPMLRPAR